MYRKFRYITAIILIITLVFSANASAYAYDTENNDTVVATDAFVQTATDENQEESVPLGFFARVASAFTTCDNAVASAIGFLQPLLADAVADVKTSAQQPDFPVLCPFLYVYFLSSHLTSAKIHLRQFSFFHHCIFSRYFFSQKV